MNPAISLARLCRAELEQTAHSRCGSASKRRSKPCWNRTSGLRLGLAVASRCVSCADGLLAQQVVRQRGHQRARQDVGRDQRKDHRLGERTEQIAGDTAQAEHRHEGDADAHQRHGGRDDDLLGAVQDCGLDLLAVLEMPVDVLDRHRRVVDQDADGERQPTERHDVDRLAEQRRAPSPKPGWRAGSRR